ncbi:MAG: beta-ketoacyl-ACP synthase III [Thermoanaerobacteraceae bacterium]|nr:beta-ketoacyl-ACP synthase III [Thermoanaerobacteraceae bacterium]
MSNLFSSGIIGIGSYVPERVLTNHDLEKLVDTSDEWITTRTGIKERHIAADTEAASDLASLAARRALEDASMDPKDIELIIVATNSPDYMNFPATACVVQDNLGAVNAAAFDLEAGCSGFIYALTVADQFIKTGMYKNILVVASEIMSKITNWDDRETCVLFGDGAGAVVLGRVEEGLGIISSFLGSDGSGGKYLLLPAGGSRKPATIDTVKNKLHTIHMDGKEVFKFAVKVMGEASLKALDIAGLTPEDVDIFIPHQANIRIIDAAMRRLNLSREKVYVNIDRFGNTSSATIPIALDELYHNSSLKKGDCVLLTAFGTGLTYASMTLRWSK